MKRLLIVALAVGLAQCERKAEAQAQAPSPAPPPAVGAMPVPGVVEVQAPKRVVPVTRSIEGGETQETVFASVVVRNGLGVRIDAAVVGCRLTDGKLLVGELVEPLPAGASTGVQAWPAPGTRIDQPGGLLPVIEACGATNLIAGGKQALAPKGQLQARVTEADFKDPSR